MDSFFVVIVVCCSVEISATNCSLVQRSPTDSDMSVCAPETSYLRIPFSPLGGSAIERM